MLNRFPRLIAFAAGMLAATGFAPLNLWPLTLVGLAVLMALVHEAPTWRAAAARGWFWGWGHFILNCNWIAHAFVFQDNMPHWLGYVAVLGVAALLAIYVALVGGVSWVLSFGFSKDRSPEPVEGRVQITDSSQENHPSTGSGLRDRVIPPLPFTLIFTACWVLSEYARATILTGFAWDPIGVVWVNMPIHPEIRSLVPFVGTYAMSGVFVCLTSFLFHYSLMISIYFRVGKLLEITQTWRTAIARSWKDGDGQWLTFIIGGLLLLLGSLFMVIQVIAGTAFTDYHERPATGTTKVTVIQPNIPEDIGNDTKQNFNNLIKHMRLSGAPDPNHSRLILWPEGALTDFVEDEPWARERLANILGPHDILAAGGDALVFDDRHHLKAARNSIFLLNAKAEIVGRYDKAHLVPGGEYLPMRAILSVIGLNRLVPGDLDFLPGPGPRALNVPGFGKMGGLICYEVIFSGEVVDRAHRPDFIFNPSTDAWFGDWGPPQHLAQAQMRALEEGLPIIRATTTGISAVINANGEIQRSLPLNTQGALISAIPPAAPPTLFSRYGNTIPLSLAFILGAIGIALSRPIRYGRNRT